MQMTLPVPRAPVYHDSQSQDNSSSNTDIKLCIPYADDESYSSTPSDQDHKDNSSCDVFTIDDLSSDYDDNHEQHSGNCDVCLDNSTVTWSHTHDTSTESSSSCVDTLV